MKCGTFSWAGNVLDITAQPYEHVSPSPKSSHLVRRALTLLQKPIQIIIMESFYSMKHLRVQMMVFERFEGVAEPSFRHTSCVVASKGQRASDSIE